MAQQNIDFGTFPNDSTADAIREAFRKTQENFTELFREQTTSGVTSLTAGNGTTVTNSAGQPQSAGALTVNSNIAFLTLNSPRRTINFGGASNSITVTQSGILNYDINTSLRLTNLVVTDSGNVGPTSTGNNFRVDSGGNIFTEGSLNVPTIKVFVTNGMANAAKRNAILYANVDGTIEGSPSFTWDDANSILSIIGNASISQNANIEGNVKINGSAIYTDLQSMSVFATPNTTANIDAFSYANNINIAELSDANVIIGAIDANGISNGYVLIRSSNSAANFSDGALRVNGGISTGGNIYANGDIQKAYNANISAHGNDSEIQFNAGGNTAANASGNLRSSANFKFNILTSTLTLNGNLNASNGTVTYTNVALTTDSPITVTNAVSITGNLSITNGNLTLSNVPLITDSTVTVNSNLINNGNATFSNGNVVLTTAPLITDSPVTINGNLTQNGNISFSNGNIVLSNAPFTTDSNLTVNGTFTHNGDTTFSNGNITFANAKLNLDINSTFVTNSNATFRGNVFEVDFGTFATFGDRVYIDGELRASSTVIIDGNITAAASYSTTNGNIRTTNGNIVTANGRIVSGSAGSLIEIGGGNIILGAGPNATINSSGDIQTIGKISAAGGNTQIQFNDGGNLGGSNTFTWNKQLGEFRVTGTAVITTLSSPNISADNADIGNLNSPNISGNGAGLSNINASNISSGTLSTSRLPNSGVTANTYGSNLAIPRITVDQWGRITSASVANIEPVEWTTDVGSIELSPGNSVNLFGFPDRIAIRTVGSTITVSTPQDIGTASIPQFFGLNITDGIIAGNISANGAGLSELNASNITTGTLNANRLANSGVNAGSYGSSSTTNALTVDQWGRITAASAVPIAAITVIGDTGNGAQLLPNTSVNIRGTANRTTVSASGNTITVTTVQDIAQTSSPTFANLTVSGNLNVSGGLSGDGSNISDLNASNLATGTLPTARLSTSGVTAGSYGNSVVIPSITVDQYGRITTASTANIANTLISTNSGNANFAIGSGISLVGTANRTTISASGNTITVTTVQDIAQTSSPTFRNIIVNGNVSATGNISGNGSNISNINASNITTGTISSLRLPNSGVTGGIYGNSSAIPLLTIDQYGRITTASSTSIAPIIVSTNSGGANLTPGSSVSIIGVANRTSVSTSANNTIVITAAQDIGTASAPTFARLNVSGVASLGGLSGGGSVSGTWTVTSGSRWQATYADLAEHYEADANYPSGTVLEIGGTHEVTLSTTADSTKIAGVVTTEPAYVLNAVNTYTHKAIIALAGRVPVRVTGPVSKGDILTSAGDGTAQVNNTPPCGAIIGRALEDHTPHNDGGEGLITVMIGK